MNNVKNYRIKKKGVIIVGGIIILLLLIWFAMTQGPEISGEGSVYLKTEKVKEEALSSIVFTSGQIQSKEKQNLSFRSSGYIETVHVDVGDFVRKGDVLAVLDQKDLEVQIRKAALQLEINQKNIEKINQSGVMNFESVYKNAKLNYESAKSQYENDKKLFDEGVISEVQYKSSKKSYEMSKNEFESAEKKYTGQNNWLDLEIAKLQLKESENSLEELKNKKQDMVIEAPFDGTISEKYAEEGQYIMANTQGFTIETVDELVVKTSVSQYDIGFLEPGQHVDISRNGDVETYEGEISEISPVATASSQSSVIPIEVEVLSETPYKPNYIVNIEITTQENEAAKVVPYEALIKDESGKHYLFVYVSGRAKQVYVERGINGPLLAEVISEELSIGDQILINPPLDLEDGDSVELIEQQE